MNPRIQELWRSCVLKHTKDPMNWQMAADEFAELIVRECIAQCESQNTVITTDTGTKAWGEISDAVEQIKQHFYGVEE